MKTREQVHVTSNQNNIIPFVTTYNPRDYNIFHFMKQIEFNLSSSERMKNFNGNVRVPYNKTIVKKTLPALSYIHIIVIHVYNCFEK